uniref:UDENN domain-containing protein n=1 Tax=Syphacia muris TaxID=451379 RepID=A0A0N5ALI3_9BILA
MSRNRYDVVTLFDVFCVVGQGDGGEKTILKKYPEDFNDSTSLRNVVLFSFPFNSSNEEEAVQLFTFVLTNEKSQYTYGYCRYTPAGVLESLLTHAYHVPIPAPRETLIIESGFGVNLVVPDSNRLPTLRDNKQLLELYSAMNVDQLIALYASLLHERRIIFTGSKLGQLTSCTSAATMLLYPMQWQNCYAPLLPEHMKSYLQAPIPFLFGVPRKIYQVDDNLSKAVVIDLQKHTFVSPYDDVHALPSEVVNGLRHQLLSSADMFLSDRFARSFLRANVYLFGNYRAGLKYSPVCSWDKDQFIQQQRSSLKIFLESLLGKEGAQYLERFLEERVEAINAGEIIHDEFEKEIMLMDKNFFRSSLVIFNFLTLFHLEAL